MVVPHVFLCWISPTRPACITLTPPTVLDSSVNSDAFHQVPAALGRAPVQFAHQVRSGVLLLPPTVVVLLTYLPAATHVTSAVAWGALGWGYPIRHLDGLVQEICNSSALAMELHLSCNNLDGLVRERRNSSALALELRRSSTNSLICPMISQKLRSCKACFNTKMLFY